MRIARMTTTHEKTPGLVDRIAALEKCIAPLWDEAGELIAEYLETQKTYGVPATFIEHNFWSQVPGERNRVSAVRHLLKTAHT